MSQREKIILGIMVGVMVFVFVTANPFHKGEDRGNLLKDPSIPAVRKENKLAAALSNEVQQTLDQFVWLNQEVKSDDVIDPFKKFDQKVIEKTGLEYTDLKLSGVIMGEHPAAVINDVILNVGDKYANFEVQDIKPGEVILIRGEEKYILKLF